jgi:hypothetical protein
MTEFMSFSKSRAWSGFHNSPYRPPNLIWTAIVPRRAGSRRDGDTIALVGSLWEIIEGTRFSEYQCVPILQKHGYSPKKDQRPALRGGRVPVKPLTDAHQVATYSPTNYRCWNSLNYVWSSSHKLGWAQMTPYQQVPTHWRNLLAGKNGPFQETNDSK